MKNRTPKAKPAPLKAAKVRVSYCPAGTTENLKGRTLPVSIDSGYIVELLFGSRRVWFLRRELQPVA